MGRLLERAMAGDSASLRELVGKLRPVIQARVVRLVLPYRSRGAKRALVHDVDDLVQHVFEKLWVNDAKELRAWSRDGVLSLLNYVGLIAERDTISVMRTIAAGA